MLWIESDGFLVAHAKELIVPNIMTAQNKSEVQMFLFCLYKTFTQRYHSEVTKRVD